MFFRISTFATLALAFTSQTIAAPAAELEARQSLSGDGEFLLCNYDKYGLLTYIRNLFQPWFGSLWNLQH